MKTSDNNHYKFTHFYTVWQRRKA